MIDVLSELYVESQQAPPDSPAQTPREKDPTEYDELKTRVTKDGKVEKRRDFSPGERVLHSFFGAPPPRDSGKAS